jgi:hypothetical protein
MLFDSRIQEQERFLVTIESGNLESSINNFEDIGSDFEEIRVISDAIEVSLVPDGLFDSSHPETYLDVCFGPTRSRMVQLHHLSPIGLHSVFGLSQSFIELIGGVFPQATFLHLRDVLIMSAWKRLSHEAGLDFSAHLQENRLALVVFNGKHLIKCTQYTIGDPTDIVYHCLNAMEIQNADYKAITLHCSGSLGPGSEAFELLRAYCPQAEFQAAPGLEKQYEDLFILAQHHLCVS